MRKPTFFIYTAKLISAFVFAAWIVQSFYFLNPKFQASSHLLYLYSLVCVGPDRKPECWLSRGAAQFCLFLNEVVPHKDTPDEYP